MFRIVSVHEVDSVDYIVAEFSGLDFDIFSTVRNPQTALS